MGLSASQARLLNLTSRMHDIEYKAQNLEAQKLQMANESQHVYQEYENALNRQKIQFKQISSDGSATYTDASVATLLKAGYKIKILNGSNWVDYAKDITSSSTIDTTTDAKDWIAFEDTPSKVTLKTALTSQKAGDYITDDGTTYKLAQNITSSTTEVSAYKPATTQPTSAQKSDLAKIDLTSETVLRNLVEAGFIVFEKPDSTKTSGFTEVNVATDTNLQEVTDDTELKKAEAKYEADMRKIDAKDKKFDTDIAALEQERNAIKTEMDTLKTVAKDNVDRTFKLFS